MLIQPRNVLQFYSSTIFRNATDEHVSSSDLNALWISWGIGLVNFLSTFPAYYYIDKRGRRFLLLTSYPIMFLCMLLTSLTFNVQAHGVRWLAIIFMIAFICSYSFGQGPGMGTYTNPNIGKHD
jgi:MFS family permease